jgi:hypothetical protein
MKKMNNTMMINNKIAKCPIELSMGVYSFLTVNSFPKILTEALQKYDYDKFVHFIEYNFLGLYWNGINRIDNNNLRNFTLPFNVMGYKDFFNICDIIKTNTAVLTEKDLIDNADKAFNLLYFITDATCLKPTQSYLITSAVLTGYDIEEKLDEDWYNVTLKFSSIPYVGEGITELAETTLKEIIKSAKIGLKSFELVNFADLSFSFDDYYEKLKSKK